MSRAAARLAETAARSRGPPRCKDRRDSARARSGARFSLVRSPSRSLELSKKKDTASSRRAISLLSVEGAPTRSASSLAPAGVTVQSITETSEPSRAPPAFARFPDWLWWRRQCRASCFRAGWKGAPGPGVRLSAFAPHKELRRRRRRVRPAKARQAPPASRRHKNHEAALG